MIKKVHRSFVYLMLISSSAFLPTATFTVIQWGANRCRIRPVIVCNQYAVEKMYLIIG